MSIYRYPELKVYEGMSFRYRPPERKKWMGIFTITSITSSHLFIDVYDLSDNLINEKRKMRKKELINEISNGLSVFDLHSTLKRLKNIQNLGNEKHE